MVKSVASLSRPRRSTAALDYFPPTDPGRFQADAMVIADNGNLRLGIPTLTISLRASAGVTVEARTPPGS